MRTSSQAETLLAVDTTGDVCSVAVLREGQLTSERTFRHGMHLSERLLDQIDGAIRDAETTFAEIAAFAVGIGPGSFTGVRIGVMTLKTLASVQEKPLYGVSDLEALAVPYVGLGFTVVPILPCRAGLVYAAGYSGNRSEFAFLFEANAFTLPELCERLGERTSGPLLFCGPSVERYQDELLIALAPGQTVVFGIPRFARASDVGTQASKRRQAGDGGEDPMHLVPAYLSPPPISQSKQPIPQPDEK